MTKKCGIYAIVNSITKERYVGKSIDIEEKWRAHIQELDAGSHISPTLQQAWDEYGADNFLFLVLKECEKEVLDWFEHMAVEDGADYSH
jgi:group I intron endonuclease